MSFFSHDVIALNAFYGVRYPLTVNAQYGLMSTVTQNINNSIAVSIPQQERYPIRLKPIGSRVVGYEHFGTTELGPLIKNSRGWLQPEKIVPSSAGFQHLGQAADFGFSRYQVGMEFKNKNGTIGAIWVDYQERTCRLVGSGVVFQQCFQGENDAQFYFLSDAEITAYRVNATFQFSVKDANKLYTLTTLGQEVGTNNAPRGGIVFIPTYSRFWVPEEYGKVYVHSVYTVMDINLTGRGCMAMILPANIDFGDVSAHDFGAKKGEMSQVINRELLSFRCAGPEQRGQYYRLVLKGDDVMNGKSALLLHSAQDKSPPLGYVLGNIEGNTPLLCDQGDPSIGLTHPNGLTWQKKKVAILTRH